MTKKERKGTRRGRGRRERGERRPREAEERARSREEVPGKGRDTALEWVKTLVLAVVLLVVIRTALVQTFVITSGSMEDTLLVGDFLMVNRAAMGGRVPLTNIRLPGYSEPRRGDVLIFDPAHEDRMRLVKRLVGMPGDTLEMRDKQFFVNGEIQDEPYVKWEDPAGDDRHPWMLWQRDHLVDELDADEYRPSRDNWGPVVVPEDHYFMLGDNRDFSLDSRYWGPLEDWRVEGRAMFFYYSYDRESTRPLAFFREVRLDRIGRRIR